MSMRALLLEPTFNIPSQNHDRYSYSQNNSSVQLEQTESKLLVTGKLLMFMAGHYQVNYKCLPVDQ